MRTRSTATSRRSCNGIVFVVVVVALQLDEDLDEVASGDFLRVDDFETELNVRVCIAKARHVRHLRRRKLQQALAFVVLQIHQVHDAKSLVGWWL